jgi:hypothetical protein
VQLPDAKTNQEWHEQDDGDSRHERRGEGPLPDPQRERRHYTALSGAETAMSLIRVLIIVVFLAILVSLGTALYHLSTERGEDTEKSAKLLRALTWRISLSVALFILLIVLWRAGWLTPHGIAVPH